MEIIANITDEIFGEVPAEMDNPKQRVGARGIVVREDGKIALFNEANKGDFKLPGGGIEGDEDPAKTFIREVYEEAGCEVYEPKEIAIIKEERTHHNFVQTSHVFVAKLKKDCGELHLTAKEKLWGGKIYWKTPEEALALIEESLNKLKNLTSENLYHLKFMVMRDAKILAYAIEKDLLRDISPSL